MPTKGIINPFPPEQGTYTLLLRVPEPLDLVIGSLGMQHFPRGFYSYTGSSLGVAQNLRTRVTRHLRTVKKRRWHIDYLLEHAQVSGVVYCTDNRRLECSIVQMLGKKSRAKAVVRDFGSSDCSQGCPTHLHYHPGLNLERLLQLVKQTYRGVGCDANILRV